MISLIFSTNSTTSSMTVRIGSTKIFEEGMNLPLSNFFMQLNPHEKDEDLIVTVLRLEFPYHSDFGSNIGFLAWEHFAPIETSDETEPQGTDDDLISTAAGWAGKRSNWLGHRLSAMKIKPTNPNQCAKMYHGTETATKNHPRLLKCFTKWNCRLTGNQMTFWWTWKSCPEERGPGRYDSGSAVCPIGTNIVNGILQTHHGNKKEPLLLPLATNSPLISHRVVEIIRSHELDYFEDYLEFSTNGIH